MTTGEKIRHYRKLRGLYQGELGERIGVSEGAIRHYETDFRTPKQPQIEAIAEALDISPLALKDFGVENARDLLGLLLQLEDEFGIVPAEDGSGLSIDASAEKAPKTTPDAQGLGREAKRAGIRRDHAGGIRRLEGQVLGVNIY